MNDGIFLGQEYVKSLRMISKEELGELMMALFDAEEGLEPDLTNCSTMVQVLYSLLQASIGRMRGASEQNSENGKKGGRPPKKTEKAAVSDEKAAVSDEKSGAFESEKPSPILSSPNQSYPNHPDMPGKGPTAEEVQEFAAQEGLVIDAERFVAYYAAKDWKTGTDPIKDWKKVARKWAVTERKEKPPDKKKPGKFSAWLESQDYSNLVNGRRA